MNSEIWLIIGFTGQLLFTLRFLVQWWQSEKQGHCVVPLVFWYFSLGGGLILLVYAVHKADPVFIVGQAAGVFVYLRNLHLIKKDRQANTFAVSEEST